MGVDFGSSCTLADHVGTVYLGEVRKGQLCVISLGSIFVCARDYTRTKGKKQEALAQEWKGGRAPKRMLFKKLKDNWHTISYQFQVYVLVIRYLYILPNDPHNNIVAIYLHTKLLQYY